MSRPDLNLLVTLDVLLTEGSVAAAARRLRLSPSAMSRALARLREVTGDPLLVRAGRGLVPTPRAMELRDRVAHLVEDAEAALRPVRSLDLSRLQRTFAIRASEGFAETFGPMLLGRLEREAPGVRLHFMAKADRQSTLLRDGSVDLETGVIGSATGPEVRALALFRDHFIGAARSGHPLAVGAITPGDYAAAGHVRVARPDQGTGPVDAALEPLGLHRNVRVTVGGFAAALALARTSDLIASVPERHTAGLREGMACFALPVPMPEVTISLMWHPRMDADPGHRWMRETMRAVCGAHRYPPLPIPR
ncbi:LysR family transcriptional regulator [Magnetospirillum sp. UT-4]|uniref:LysR family transcriptional regulator n=1 Tax=Magnetospirillum sp. UT-4 TaxID=2681467 RepID=UPI00137D06FB|nr:LysR family transcriptional regulator [Magnetospirillum sp. UT-4]CAA7626535.1 Transcriptional regulator [Magnetospirillum sp. UT-4]